MAKITSGFVLEQRTLGRWRAVRTFATLADAQAFAFALDPDGLLVDVRVRSSDGSVIKPASLSRWPD